MIERPHEQRHVDDDRRDDIADRDAERLDRAELLDVETIRYRCNSTTGAACIEVTSRVREIERRRLDGTDPTPLLDNVRRHAEAHGLPAPSRDELTR